MLLGRGDRGARRQELIARGADKVYVVDQPELAYFQDEPYAAVLIDLVEQPQAQHRAVRRHDDRPQPGLARGRGRQTPA